MGKFSMKEVNWALVAITLVVTIAAVYASNMFFVMEDETTGAVYKPKFKLPGKEDKPIYDLEDYDLED